MQRAALILSDGSRFDGVSFGYEADVMGETVFNTAMVGYVESLTDPSYAGQILVLTYPLVGNYGVPSYDYINELPAFMESDKIHVRALVVADYSENFSHWNAHESLSSWLQREHIPALTGIDTRALTKVLREKGVMMGRIVLEGAEEKTIEEKYEGINFVEQVSCKEVINYKPEGESVGRVVLVDCGVKANILRCLVRRGVEVLRVPWDYDFNTLPFDALFLANGPGDPSVCGVTVEHIRSFLAASVRPCMGICMGNQLLAAAAGATIYKMKYGHRSHNQPVRLVGSDRCFITTQNHGYAVEPTTLDADWQPLFVNMNDDTNEGIRHTSRPWFSAQFHPEASAGPVDTEFLFDNFIEMIKQSHA